MYHTSNMVVEAWNIQDEWDHSKRLLDSDLSLHQA